ncbi:hypothetical protein K503DRAFT_266196 [Rhizopogon vinicolor AM-OR11-026]|uniref:DNA mitochondrial polymerase exonuclease domain-containing protein n=1 Tax=Rhizopogon vinicolor AM-OR11-026 TaxID=1314800 RepID=A0A1B7MWG8_9AGAM|nr:hypothetical protein K503DRAFT_266196 [Rhizopogon vinicolor AM-OR11-026]
MKYHKETRQLKHDGEVDEIKRKVLQCNIDVDNEIRHDIMHYTPEDIVDNIHNYLTYCAQDVFVTNAVFSKVLPAFLEHCSSPVSLVSLRWEDGHPLSCASDSSPSKMTKRVMMASNRLHRRGSAASL